MRGIIQANIDRFTELLRTETDETKRAMLTRLLREEEVKLAELPKPEKKWASFSSCDLQPRCASASVKYRWAFS
jgi:hypothetical protein